MRIKKISSDKIVVQLTDTDLEYFDLDIGDCVPQAADLHKFLFEVMELVQTETGFDPYHGGQVVVEASTSANGMSLIISKIHCEKKRVSRDEFARLKGIRVKNSIEKVSSNDIKTLIDNAGISHKKQKKCISNNSVFIFETFADFEAAVNVLDTFNFVFASLYRDKEKYALISAAFTLQEKNIISEYSVQSVSNDVVAFDIKEGWTLVAKDNELCEMAENLRDMN